MANISSQGVTGFVVKSNMYFQIEYFFPNRICIFKSNMSFQIEYVFPNPICLSKSNMSFQIFAVAWNWDSVILYIGRSQWPRVLRRRPSAARLLRLWVRIPPGACMFFFCECCVLSGRGLCAGLITRPEESYRLWCVVVCDQETSNTRRLKSATGLWKYNHNGL